VLLLHTCTDCRYEKVFPIKYLVAHSNHVECFIRGSHTSITPRSSSCLRESGSVRDIKWVQAAARRKAWLACSWALWRLCLRRQRVSLIIDPPRLFEGVGEGANVLWSRIGFSVEGDMNGAQLRTKVCVGIMKSAHHGSCCLV